MKGEQKLEMDKKIYEETKLMKYSEEEEEKIEMEKQKETMKKLAQAKAEQIAAEEERRIKDKYTAAHIKLMELERRIAERNAKLQPSLENTDEPKKLRLQIKKKIESVQDINKINEIQAVPKIEPIQISQSHLELHSTNKKGKLLIRNRNMPDVREIKDFKSYEQSLQDKINQTIVEPKRVEAIDTPTDTLPIINESMQKKKNSH